MSAHTVTPLPVTPLPARPRIVSRHTVNPAATVSGAVSHRTVRARVQASPGARSAAQKTPVRRSATRAPGAIRLTPRGRIAAFTASVLALAMILIGAGQVAGASADTAAVSESAVVVVQAGQTLWGIAQEVAPGHDPRGVVRQIREINGLGTTAIVPGQSILVPVSG